MRDQGEAGCARSMCEQYWSEKLSKLDLERECSASQQSCWLCDDLDTWNSVLNVMQLSLVEWRVGKLQLRTQAGRSFSNFDNWNVLYDGSLFLVWLLRKHSCIESLSLGEGFSHPHVTAPLDSVTRHASNLRHISITDGAFFDWALVLDAVAPTQQLEELEVGCEVAVSRRLASTLGEILSNNSSSIKKVAVSAAVTDASASNIIMRGISKCDNLQQLTLGLRSHPCGFWDFVRLLQSTQSLHTLNLLEEIVDDSSSTESDEDDSLLLESASTKGHDEELLEDPFAKILTELENNSAVTCLIITGWDKEPVRIGSSRGALLRSLLSKNQTLRSLILEGCLIDGDGARQISDGLRDNQTLECLDISGCDVKRPAVAVLFSALKGNTSLHLLKIGYIGPPSSERNAVSTELARNQWYHRVQVRWINMDTEGLVPAISEPLLCPTELQLHTNEFPEESFSALCSALSLSQGVKNLTVYLWSVTPAHVASLRQMLESNQSLRSLTLHDGYEQPGFAVMAAQGLYLHTSVTELELVCYEMSSESAELLATLLSGNENLHKLVLSCESGLTLESLDALSQGLLHNRFITEVRIGCITPVIRRAVQRNVLSLHRAASFVLMHDVGKLCAEAFELLESKATLTSHLMSTSGMTETEAKSAVQAARRFIWSNYFFINKIVCHRLECYPRVGTQIDKLNFECWVAIAKHLKVSDVCN